MEEKITQAISDALEHAPKRKFVESVDIAFTIKDVDLKNPNNRIEEEVRLPSGRGKELKSTAAERKRVQEHIVGNTLLCNGARIETSP